MKQTIPIIKSFGVSGYHLEQSLLDPAAIADVRHFLEESRHRSHQLLEQWTQSSIRDNADFAWHQERIAEYEKRGLPKDLRHYLVGEFDLETRLDRRICGLLAAPRVRATLSGFLGRPRYYVHYPPMVRFKMADVPGSILPPHQDFTYNTHLRDFITAWVPLVDIDDQVGGLILYDGSHFDGTVEHASRGPWAHGLSRPPESRYSKHPVYMRAGDILLFPPLLIHESAPHTSQSQLRYSVDFRIFMAPEDSAKSYFDPFEDRIIRQD